MHLKPLKWYKKLATKKGRLESGAFLVEGERAIRQIITVNPGKVLEIITTSEPTPPFQAFPVRYVDDSQFRSLCFTKTPQGPIAVIRLNPETYSDQLPGNLGAKVLLLEDIQDPGNVGALIRTAAAFDFSGIILAEKCADPLSPKCVQSSAGSVLSVWLRKTARYLELAESLKKKGYYLVAADLDGAEDASILSSREKLLLALGNEAWGPSQSLLHTADHQLKIPINRKSAESLNVAACGAICMYLSSQRC
jgi:TrmH family RNA methyltransferase